MSDAELKELYSKLDVINVERSKLVNQIDAIEVKNDPVCKLLEVLKDDLNEFKKVQYIKQKISIPCTIELDVDGSLFEGDFNGEIECNLAGLKPKQRTALLYLLRDGYIDESDEVTYDDISPEFKTSVAAVKKVYNKMFKKAIKLAEKMELNYDEYDIASILSQEYN